MSAMLSSSSPLKSCGRLPPKERPQDELHLAVLTGRTKRIKYLLRKGVHIESVNSHGQTPLFCASFGGDNEVVSLLLRLGANPNRRCGVKGASPVHGAAYRGSRRVLRLLAEAGGDLRLQDNEGQTPRDYSLKQPSPIRRQKILHFLDLVVAMTLHRGRPRHYPVPPISVTTTTNNTPSATLAHAASKTNFALRRQGSLASVWGSCVSEGDPTSPRTPPYTPAPTSNLHKTVSCHLLDQMYVSTSLPLLTPADLKRPDVTGIAYTCGGPTVYSPYTWLGTNVTVRRPTPALTLPRHKDTKAGDEDINTADQAACNSLLQELSILRRLRHPAFLGVMAACHVTAPQPDYITLVFQQVALGSLYHHLHVQHHDLSVGGAVEILTGIVEALLFLHAHNWLHCALSSHAFHLTSPTHAKLGGFEFATQVHGKGCSMKAPDLVRATWLHPWQAPETLTDQMVSTRSEIYSLTTIIWEIWSGMPPWSGVEDEEVVKRVGGGEVLPPVASELPSLVTYLTQYGLKWNAHERELDLSEIHTMLRSLKIQSNEEDRVPAVPAWGPPSIPNTPVIGRHSQPSLTYSQTCPAHSQTPSRKISTCSLSSQSEEQNAGKPLPVRKGSKSSTLIVSGEVHQPGSLVAPEAKIVGQAEKRTTHSVLGETTKVRGGNVGGVDSGFSTPCTRTPSPSMDTIITSAKINPSFLTSTPSRPLTTCVLRADLPPDLLPNKISLQALTSVHTPDILTRTTGEAKRNPMTSFQPPTSPVTPTTDSPTDDDEEEIDGDESKVRGRRGSSSSGYEFISNAAKRAFLMETEGGEEDMKGLLERPSSACTNQRLEHEAIPPHASEATRRMEVVRRGLSMTNIHSHTPAFTCFTRTTSHVSLASASSSSSSSESRRPVRTVSQVTLTLKKLSQVSDSTSSSSKDEVNDPTPEQPLQQQQKLQQQQQTQQQQLQQQQRPRRYRLVPKSPGHTARSPRIRKEGCTSGWEEITGIKPASHQVTRHSSSCSLASVPSSPTHHYPPSPTSSLLPTSPRHHHHHPPPPPPQTSLTLPNNSSPSKQMKKGGVGGVGRRWSSLGGMAAGLEETAVRVATRRNSEGQRARHRRTRRRQEVEVEEEFFDDEFNASLFQQPHMQLSVGSSENLLDSRAPHSMLADGAASPASLVFSSFSPSLTTSEDEVDEAELKGGTARAAGRARWGRLGAVKEDGSSQEEAGDDEEHSTNQWRSDKGVQGRKDGQEENRCKVYQNGDVVEDKECREGKRNSGDESKLRMGSETDGGNSEDSELGPWRFKDFGKEFEPLKSVQLLRNLEKSLSTYLPTHTIGSDTETGEP